MVGKYAALSGADQGIGGDQVLFGAPDVRPALQQFGRQAGRDGRQQQLIDVLAADDRAGVAAEQHAQAVLLLGDGLFQRRNAGQRLFVLRFVLAQLEQRDDPAFETQLEQLIRLAAALRRRLGDLQLAVQVAQVDVGARNAADQRQDDAVAALLAGQQLRIRRLGLAADTAPDVDFPTGVEDGAVAVIGRWLRGPGRNVPLAAYLVTGADLREESGADEAVFPGKFVDARRGNHQILVLAQRRIDQIVEHRVAELLPPGGIGQILRLRLGEPPGSGRIHRRSYIVRPDHAATDEQRNQGSKQCLTHGRPPCQTFRHGWPCRHPPCGPVSRPRRRASE